MNTRITKLDQLRKEIDVLDSEIVMLLAKRMRLSSAIGQYKASHGIAPRDNARWQEVLISRIKQGKEIGLDPILVRRIFDVIHKYSLFIQQHQK